MSDRTYYSEEAKSAHQRRDIAMGLASLAVGAGLGATVAMLFAPEDGEKTRKMIAEAVQDGFDKGKEATFQAIDQLQEEYPDIGERIQKAVDRFQKETDED